MTLQEELEKAERRLFEAHMCDSIGGNKMIADAKEEVARIKKQIAEHGEKSCTHL